MAAVPGWGTLFAMSRWFAGAALAATLLGAAVAAPRLFAQAAQPPRGIVATFGQVCASCHGPNGSGGSAPSLLDDTWAHGGSDAELAASIKNGWPGTPMPPFGATLNEQDIRAMVIYIRELRDRAASSPLSRTGPPPLPTGAVTSEQHAFRVETVVEGLQNPWDVEILPDGALLVPERSGRLRIFRNGVAEPPITGLPPVWVRQDGGLMDVALHPDYEKTGWLYLAFSETGGAAEGRVDDADHPRPHQGRRPHRAADALPGPAGSLLAGQYALRLALLLRQGQVPLLRDRRSRPPRHAAGPEEPLRQDPSRPRRRHGAVRQPVREHARRSEVDLELRPPQPAGHRRRSGDRALWASEHGPRGGDELNLIEKGKNYGWPAATHGMNYDGTPMTPTTVVQVPGMVDPVLHWTPSIAVSGISFYRGDKFPKWKGHLFAAGLAGQQLVRLEVANGKVTHQETLLRGFGRIRHVVNAPDGTLLVVFDTPGRIVRLVPAP